MYVEGCTEDVSAEMLNLGVGLGTGMVSMDELTEGECEDGGGQAGGNADSPASFSKVGASSPGPSSVAPTPMPTFPASSDGKMPLTSNAKSTSSNINNARVRENPGVLGYSGSSGGSLVAG